MNPEDSSLPPSPSSSSPPLNPYRLFLDLRLPMDDIDALLLNDLADDIDALLLALLLTEPPPASLPVSDPPPEVRKAESFLLLDGCTLFASFSRSI